MRGCAQVITFNASNLAAGNPLVTSGPGQNVFRSDVPGGVQQYRPTTMQDSLPGDPMWLIHNGDGGTDDGSTVDVVKMTNILSSFPSFSTTPLSLPAADRFNPLPVFPQNPDTTVIQTASADELAGNSGDITNAATKIDDRILKAAEYNDTIVATNSVPVGTAFVAAASLQLDSMSNPIGGSGYQVGDILTISGGTFTTATTLRCPHRHRRQRRRGHRCLEATIRALREFTARWLAATEAGPCSISSSGASGTPNGTRLT